MEQTLNFTLQRATNMFGEMFGTLGSKTPSLAVKTVRSKKSVETGYNLGFNKGSFATTFDQREYFERNIRPANKKSFEPGI